jgi:hypothetical protein
MKANLVVNRYSSFRFVSVAALTGLLGGLLSAVVGYTAGGLVGQFFFESLDPAALLLLQVWAICGAAHAVYYSIRSQTGSGSYIGIIAGGLGAGLLVFLLWGLLPETLSFGLIFLLPVAGALAGYFITERSKKTANSESAGNSI